MAAAARRGFRGQEAEQRMARPAGSSTRDAAMRMDASWAARAGDPPIHRLFEAQVRLGPGRIALVQGERRLTYAELNARANHLARRLIGLGVGRDRLVGICLPRSIETVIALLAALKAGGAYVPFDPTYPKERLAGMLADVAVQVLITTSAGEAALAAASSGAALPPRLILDRAGEAIEGECATDPDLEVDPESLAYVIFTSGSTGRPKAAAVTHRGWSNLMLWFRDEFAIGPADKVLLISSFSFDISQRAIAMPLIAGGELHLFRLALFDPALALRTIAAERISLLNCPPVMLYLMLESAKDPVLAALHPLRLAFLGGEAISASRLEALARARDLDSAGPGLELVNVYGVAECSDVSAFHRLGDGRDYVGGSVPIGRAIRATSLRLLDEDLAPVAVGEIGEICIGGTGVGRGYLNDPALTATKFIPDPASPVPGARLYRTGDLGRLDTDGLLHYHGRGDHQVKLRGLRIELGEVEAALRRHPAVRDAVVLCPDREKDERQLVAFLVLQAESEPGLAPALRRFLGGLLPRYMVPSRFMVLPDLPLNPNGKIDRKALLARAGSPSAASSGG